MWKLWISNHAGKAGGVIASPSKEESGKLLKHYQCAYCNARRKKFFNVAKIIESDDQYVIPTKSDTKQEAKSVNLIRLEIIQNTGENHSVEFTDTRKAILFLQDLQREVLSDNQMMEAAE